MDVKTTEAEPARSLTADDTTKEVVRRLSGVNVHTLQEEHVA
jgi:hypothetical protein